MDMTIRRAVVTGVAGFIGSHLAERLVELGVEVTGLDCLTPYYSREVKRANLRRLAHDARFVFHETDLCRDPLDEHLDGAEVVFHQAAQPGVRASWADGFPISLENNVLGTQRLLEASCRIATLRRFVFASSSSVYGDAGSRPMREDGPVRPFSPYGVTKLSAEQLCTVYASNWGLPTVSLRYFTVYGPRQRPDMAIHRLIVSALTGREFPLFGTGEQLRDFTFVGDVVEANLAAATTSLDPGTILNVAGGSSISMNDLIDLVDTLAGRRPNVRQQKAQAGDVRVTSADLSRVGSLLRWQPEVELSEGLRVQVRWHQAQASTDTQAWKAENRR